MKLEALEKEDSKLALSILGESHTLLNLLREKCWKAGATQAAYMIEHPYLAQPKIIVRGKNPTKILRDAAQLAEDDVEEFLKEFKRAVKK